MPLSFKSVDSLNGPIVFFVCFFYCVTTLLLAYSRVHCVNLAIMTTNSQ